MSKTREIANKLIDGMNDVTITSPVDGQLLKWNGTNWVNETGVIVKNGNVGINVTPSAWSGYAKVIDIGNTTSLINWNNLGTWLSNNMYYSDNYRYKVGSRESSLYMQDSGRHIWYTAPSGTAGNPITWNTAMTLDASGSLSVSGSGVQGNIAMSISGDLRAYACAYDGSNGAATNARFSRNTTTNRSINAGGTINASGADYAEYEYNNGISFSKGQIVGFKSDGTITDKYSESIRFAIKSTNPSYVGGDTWGNEEMLGKKPEQPIKADGISDDDFTKIEAQYKTDLVDFEARLEVERQKVDRIAYSGKVPVNVYGAKAGQYVIAVEKDGGIDGKLVNKSDMTFAEYQDAVGRVNKILDDGRAEVAVIIH